jgi:hypothetical protein
MAKKPPPLPVKTAPQVPEDSRTSVDELKLLVEEWQIALQGEADPHRRAFCERTLAYWKKALAYANFYSEK